MIIKELPMKFEENIGSDHGIFLIVFLVRSDPGQGHWGHKGQNRIIPITLSIFNLFTSNKHQNVQHSILRREIRK